MDNPEELIIRQLCPSCNAELDYVQRYPKMICMECHSLITDINGRKVKFYNTTPLGGGCQGYFASSIATEIYDSNLCYIKNEEYYAQVARFGGIVIQKREKK